jgi:hypothetical protein
MGPRNGFREVGCRSTRVTGDTDRGATSGEVKDLRQAQELKEVVAEQALERRLLKKTSPHGSTGTSSGCALVRNLQPSLGLELSLLPARRLKRVRSFGQGCLIEHGQERR